MEMRKSIFLPIPKKPKTQNCTDFRTISSMSHITRLLLKIIQIRIKDRQRDYKLQNGFGPGKVLEKEFSTSEQHVKEQWKWERIFLIASLIILSI